MIDSCANAAAATAATAASSTAPALAIQSSLAAAARGGAMKAVMVRQGRHLRVSWRIFLSLLTIFD